MRIEIWTMVCPRGVCPRVCVDALIAVIPLLKLTLFLQSLAEDWEDLDSDEELECEDVDEVDEVEQEADEEEAGGPVLLGAIPVTDCLFCPHHSSSLLKNVAHMTKTHSFFIPDIEYLWDLRGLIQYLGRCSAFLCQRTGVGWGLPGTFVLCSHPSLMSLPVCFVRIRNLVPAF